MELHAEMAYGSMELKAKQATVDRVAMGKSDLASAIQPRATSYRIVCHMHDT